MVVNMKEIDSSPEFLRRKFHLTDGEDVFLLVKYPTPFEGGQDYKTEFVILGIGDEAVRQIGGVDEIQSLLLALRVAASLLMTFDEYKSGRLYWLKPGDPDLGLPV